ncbi:MAG: beta-glucosidase, partial [Candidatus Saccharimonadales bacterium]
MNDKDRKIFPKDFLWGASTASHQVEGGTENQWTVWELENAAHLSKTAEERLSWMPAWEEVKGQATDPENYISANGVEHYTKYSEDFKIAKSLNLNSFRFGIEWSRVEPVEGQWDDNAWKHYREYIEELLDLGIEPIMNLWHWTMPTWFTDKGGFAKRKNLRDFDRFVAKACEELPVDKLKFVITLNEPNVYSSFGYMTAEWPPQQKSFFTFVKVYYNLTRAHIRSYKILKAANPDLQIGVAAQLANIQAKRPQNLLDLFATRWMRYFWNWWFLNRIRKHQDYVGFNYYFTDYYRFGSFKDIMKKKFFYTANPELPKNDLGWYMEPEGIYPLMVRIWAHYKKPIMITENGLADRNDEYRRWWIEESIVAMERARSEGIGLIGYMHWSLLDNFEWAFGWWPQFGLVHVDRKTMKRTVRP